MTKMTLTKKPYKKYAGYVSASKQTNTSTGIIARPVYVEAVNKNEALGKLISYCRDIYLESEGFYSHIADVVEIEKNDE